MKPTTIIISKTYIYENKMRSKPINYTCKSLKKNRIYYED